MKKIFLWIPFLLCILFTKSVNAQQEPVNQIENLSAESAIIMEATTGKIIFEIEGDTKKPPASVTKIMTLLLIFEDLSKGTISLQDKVTVSAYAASMGGSQVYLEQGEIQTVETLIKCIAVSSANDGCVAMAEYISGSELAFVERMNKKAEELGMTNTHFVNCCGLDAEGHLTTAKDIGIMSKELINKYPDIFQYSSIWMEEIKKSIYFPPRKNAERGKIPPFPWKFDIWYLPLNWLAAWYIPFEMMQRAASAAFSRAGCKAFSS